MSAPGRIRPGAGSAFAQLLVVSVIVAAAKITFNAASGACLKAVVHPRPARRQRPVRVHGLDRHRGRTAAGRRSDRAVRPGHDGARRRGELSAVGGWRACHRRARAPAARSPHGRHGPRRAVRGPATCSTAGVTSWPTRACARCFFNAMLVNGLIMATEPLIAILMLRPPRVPAVAITGLAFAAPCVGGVIGSRLARRLAARFGRHPVLLAAGTLRVCWPLGLAFVRPGAAGLVLVIVVQFGLVTSCAVFNPLLATRPARPQRPGPGLPHPGRVVGQQQSIIAALTALCGERWPPPSAHAQRSASPASSSWARRCCCPARPPGPSGRSLSSGRARRGFREGLVMIAAGPSRLTAGTVEGDGQPVGQGCHRGG